MAIKQKMARRNRISKPGWLLTAILLTLLVGGGLVTLCCAKNGEQIIPDDIPDSVMDYIKQNHLDAAPFIKEDMSWTKSSPVILDGYSRDFFTGDGWKVTVGHAVTAEVIYEVRTEHNGERIVWVGTVKDGTITEESYTKN